MVVIKLLNFLHSTPVSITCMYSYHGIIHCIRYSLHTILHTTTCTQADDFERQIAGPRREQKLKELEDKMKSIRGLKDEGTPLGGSTRSSRLLQQSHDSQDESDEGDESGGWVTINLRLPDGSVRRKFRTSQKVKVRENTVLVFT